MTLELEVAHLDLQFAPMPLSWSSPERPKVIKDIPNLAREYAVLLLNLQNLMYVYPKTGRYN